MEGRRAGLDVVHSHLYAERRRLLVDRRGAEPPTAEFVDTIAHVLGGLVDETAGERVAILVGDDANFGMARMTQLRTQVENRRSEKRVFREYDAAVRWLTD